MEKSGAESLVIHLENNSPDTVKRLCELCPGVRVDVRGGGECTGITFSPHTDSINMDVVELYSGQDSGLHQLVSVFQSWTVRDGLGLYNFGPEDWTDLIRTLDTLDSSVR